MDWVGYEAGVQALIAPYERLRSLLVILGNDAG